MNIHIFPIFLKIFPTFFPDYMKSFHHKYASEHINFINKLVRGFAAETEKKRYYN